MTEQKKIDQPAAEKKATIGRPSSYTEEKANSICERLADGESLRSICEDENMPSRVTVFSWLSKNSEFLNQYTRAREAQAEAMIDEIFEIADDARNDWMEKINSHGEVTGVFFNKEAAQRSKLRVDARMWAASKLLPKKYGDKLGITDGEGGALKVMIQRFGDNKSSGDDNTSE